ncbi:unnamed protein product [Adineta steineri]|uniref:Uncharacterized protein n=1 Tax=Adineta steineri TaxID=433720 RepID=A0A815PUU0_9BILA|nr:unnamed protein product [Adineta steineri]
MCYPPDGSKYKRNYLRQLVSERESTVSPYINKNDSMIKTYISKNFTNFTEFIDNTRAAIMSRRLIGGTRIPETIFRNPPFQDMIRPSCDGLWMEFGVFRGNSLTHIADWKRMFCGNNSQPVYGFDTFTGLPTDWRNGEMAKYAINDCTSVAELFIHMYPEKFNNYSIPPAKNYINDLSDISDDELIEMLRPKFNNKQHELIVTTTQQEMDEINQPEPQQPQEINQQQQQQQNTLTKQQKKNLKLKGKQQNLPQFQLKIKRPIYYRYDYRKIRSQLLDDKIYTSKQITIDRKYSEVVIGFKTQERFQYATKIMRINYFSKESYNNRW